MTRWSADPFRHTDASYRRALRPWMLAMGVLCSAAATGLLLDTPKRASQPPAASPPAIAAPPVAVARNVRIDVLSEPVGAEIFIDAVYVGRTPARLVPARVDRKGRLALELRRSGHRTLRRDLVLGPGVEHARVELRLHSE